METLEDKRARLREQLEQAYGDWIAASERCTKDTVSRAPVDTSGCPDPAKAAWFKYLDARKQLIAAFAELPELH